MCAILPLEGENLSYVRLKFSSLPKRRALIDTGSCANALPQNLFDELEKQNPNGITLETPSFTSVRMASGQKIVIDKQAKISFSIGPHFFTDSFLILPTMNSVILGNPFFKKFHITIDPTNNLLQLPDLTVQLNEISAKRGKKRTLTTKIKRIPILLTKKVHLSPQSQKLLECQLDDQYAYLKNCTGIVVPNENIEDKPHLALTSSPSKLDNNKLYVSALNLCDHQITLSNKTIVGYFEILTESQAEHLAEIDPQLISLAKLRNPDNFENELNQLIHDVHFKKHDTLTGRPPPNYEKLWFPTPETCSDLSDLTPLQRDIYDQILQFQRLEKMNPKVNSDDRDAFLKKFTWDSCVLTANFLQLHLRDAALRIFQTLSDATRADLDLSLTALRDRFCNPHLQELHVLNLENLKFDSKTDTPENFLVTLQTKALKAYPDPTLVPIAPIDGAAPDAAVEQTRFDQETARNAEQLRSAQEARSIQIRRQFIKNMPGWLRAKLLEQPETTSVEDLCIFARKQLTIHNL